MAVEIQRTHHLNKAATREMVEEIAASLGTKLNMTYRWEDDRLVFQRVGVKGHIAVADHTVRVFVSKSPLLPISEGWIRTQVEAVMDQYLGARS